MTFSDAHATSSWKRSSSQLAAVTRKRSSESPSAPAAPCSPLTTPVSFSTSQAAPLETALATSPVTRLISGAISCSSVRRSETIPAGLEKVLASHCAALIRPAAAAATTMIGPAGESSTTIPATTASCFL